MLTTSWVSTNTQSLAKRLPFLLRRTKLRRPADMSFIWMKNMPKMWDIGLTRTKVYLGKTCWRLVCRLKLIHRSQQAKLRKRTVSPSWHSAALCHSYEEQGQVGRSLLCTCFLHTEESYSQYTCVLNVDAAQNIPNLGWWY